MYDIVIIGSGPAGLSSAIYAQRAGLKTVVVEKNYLGTGQIAESERVDNYPGLYGENGFDLGEKFRSHAESLGTEFIEGEAVKISKNTTDYSIELDNGNSLETHTVIYAVGTERRKLQVEGEKSFRAEEYRIAQFVTLHFIKIKSQLLQAAEIPHLVMRLCFQSLQKKFILFIAEINSEPIKPYSKKLKIFLM